MNKKQELESKMNIVKEDFTDEEIEQMVGLNFDPEQQSHQCTTLNDH